MISFHVFMARHLGLCVFFISFLVVSAFWADLFVYLKHFGIHDFYYFMFQNAVGYHTVIDFKELPLWNPFYLGGASILGNIQNGFFSPAGILVLFLGPLVGLKVSIVFFSLIGCFGFFLLLRHLGVCRFPIMFGAMSLFVFNTHIVFHLAEGHLTWLPIFYFPYLLLFFLKSCINFKFVPFGGGVIALMVYGGATYVLVFSLFFLFLFSLLTSIQRGSSRAVFVFVIMTIFGILFSAPKLLPVLEQMKEAPYSHPLLGGRSILEGLALLLRRDSIALFNLRDSDHLNGCYFGVISLSIIFCSIGWLWRRYWPWLICVSVVFIIGLGNFSPYAPWTLLHSFPVFNSLWEPPRAFCVLILIVPVLLGLGMSALFRKTRSSMLRRILMSIALVIAIDAWFVARPIVKQGIEEDIILWRTKFDHQEAFQQTSSKQTYEKILSNKGTVDAYEPLQILRSAVSDNDNSYRGEWYLLNNNGEVFLSKWSPNKMALSLKITTSDVLVINQNYHKGWQCDKGCAVFSYKGLLAVRVSPSTTQVCLRFFEPSLGFGLFLFVVGILLGLLWFKFIGKFNFFTSSITKCNT